MTSTCPNVLVNGTCGDNTCTYAHTILTCQPCGFVFQSPDDYNHHLKSKKHRSKTQGEANVYYCPICEANIPALKGWEQHIQGRNHQRKAESAGVSPVDVAPQPPVSTATATACDLCQIVLSNRFWNEHLNTQNHKLREQYGRYITAVEQSETNKNGVIVEGSLDFEFIDPPVAKELTVIIKASHPSNGSVLLEAKLASAQGPGKVSS
jgi:helicase MOV-10